jgi:hypothetical protein
MAAAMLSAAMLYLLSIAIETPVLIVGLSQRHDIHRRIFAGIWLTACTYPVVAFVLPALIDPNQYRGGYLTVAETFAPLAECTLFWLAFRNTTDCWREICRDFATIVTANLASFLIGEAVFA